ncbi:ketopantoate reductase family protein [Salinisphaera japonica]|uniref:2-dehydropantoate 2-reductase n=1 Tax=Salinisphaera japonica YTM-1 TaxID=1209778 RepID=A0A423PYP8_9GAMM|nr:2-dehydropantoate 2-reductase [Salinisphaera japonica]ROO30643.1 2-dehydropantoate 2-reductase [Salinisphaera japonica YTM-1]
MNHPAPPAGHPWHIVGCGRMGTLAAFYLQRAGASVTVIRPGRPHQRRVHLRFAGDTRSQMLALPVRPPEHVTAVTRLVVACKTPYSAARLAPIDLAPDALVLRLQNGIGSLDGLLRPSQRLIEVVTASAVKSDTPETLDVVAENETAFGGGTPPADWPTLARAWPGAQWEHAIRMPQWRKLVVNAVLNPLTALYDVRNGALVDNTTLMAPATALAAEADTILATLDGGWPGGSIETVRAVAHATAANTSSMRADLQAGALTEIEAINGWLVAQAKRLGVAAPEHEAIIARIRARHPAL